MPANWWKLVLSGGRLSALTQAVIVKAELIVRLISGAMTTRAEELTVPEKWSAESPLCGPDVKATSPPSVAG